MFNRSIYNMNNKTHYLISCLSCILLSGCGFRPPIVSVSVPNTDETLKQCNVGSSNKPFVVGWATDDQSSLDIYRRKGVVMVSYVGCTMKILNCSGAGKYEDFPTTTLLRSKIEIKDNKQLTAKLPTMVTRLSGKIEDGQKIELNYIIAAQSILKSAPLDAPQRGQLRG